MADTPTVQLIPLEDLKIGKGQIRLRNVGAEIDELAESIRVLGLLEPILVARTDNEKFEILAGQRRFLAVERLGHKEILAVVREPVSEVRAKTISLAENLMRRDITLADKIDACTALYKQYGSFKIVAEETGFKESLVRQFVRYEQLDAVLKEMIDIGQLDMGKALKIQRAASASGKFNADDARKLASEMPSMSSAQQDQLVRDREEEPEKQLDDLIEEQKTSKKITQILVTLLPKVKTQLDSFAMAEGTTLDDAAKTLIEEGLNLKGFGTSD